MRACCLDPRAALATLALLLFGGPAARPLAVLVALAAIAVLAMLVRSLASRASRYMIARFLPGAKSTVIYMVLGTSAEKLVPQLGSWLGGAPGGLPGPILESFWDAFGVNLEPPGTSEIVLPSRREHVSHQNRVLRADFALGGAPGPILEAFWRIF